MHRKLTRQYFFIVLLLSLAIAVIIRFPMVISYFFGESGGREHERFIITFTHMTSDLVITFIVAILLFTLNFFILNPTEKHGRLKLLNFGLAVVLTVIAVYILNHLLFSLRDIINPLEFRRMGHRVELDLTNFFVSGLVIGCVLIIRMIFQKQTIMVENEALRREALQSQFESLKNQLSPHFLFNSLTALKVLIQDEPDKAQIYVTSLSKALRYSLQSNEQKLVTLREEMEFMEYYLFLIRMRFDTNLTIETNIKEQDLSLMLPPLTVQTLVENAIKHNEISKRRPLKIKIFTSEGESLIVVNDIQKKYTQEEGTGIGLTNLSKQIQLLTGKDIIISQDNNLFRVEVPLIKNNK